MSGIYRLHIDPPLLNSSCPWASSKSDIEALYACKFTGAVTTRTATMKGFDENGKLHTVAFSKKDKISINSYGYSPHPLGSYIEWVGSILTSHSDSPGKKPFIVSITSSSPDELLEMVNQIQVLRKSLTSPSNEAETDIGSNIIAIEMNTSCPNIPSHPPPAYSPDTLRPLIAAFAIAFKEDPTLTLGLKLAPFVYRKQQEDILNLINEFTDEEGRNPIAFLTCTNTLGGCTMFLDQTTPNKDDGQTFRVKEENRPTENGNIQQDHAFVGPRHVALPTTFGGLAGDAIHYLSLGNVLAFSDLIKSHSDPAVRRIGIIGVGGVTNPAAYRRMRQAGARAVACATALGLEGIGIFEQLLDQTKKQGLTI